MRLRITAVSGAAPSVTGASSAAADFSKARSYRQIAESAENREDRTRNVERQNRRDHPRKGQRYVLIGAVCTEVKLRY